MQYEIDIPSRDRVEKAQNSTTNSSWSIANQLLYKMCEDHPMHGTDTEIVSKFWLIGRAYSASVERRKTTGEQELKPSENFYEHRLVDAIRRSKLDEKLSTLHDFGKINYESLDTVVDVHEYLTHALFGITNQRKISLASKYLHFHFPDLYFIYDSRAQTSLRNNYIPKWSHNRTNIDLKDKTYYYKFCSALVALQTKIFEDYSIWLTPEQIDSLLLD